MSLNSLTNSDPYEYEVAAALNQSGNNNMYYSRQMKNYNPVVPPQPSHTNSYEPIPSLPVVSTKLKKKLTEIELVAVQDTLKNFYSNERIPFNDEYTVSEELVKNEETLKEVASCLHYSESVRLKTKAAFIPFYVTHVAKSSQWCEGGFFYDDKKTTSFNIKLENKAFLSCTDYAQPPPNSTNPLPISNIPTGNLKNCLLVSIDIRNVASESNNAIALVLGEMSSEGANSVFTPYEKRGVYVSNTHAPDSMNTDKLCNLVHFVVPPKFQSDEFFTLYKSGFELNSAIGAKFPDFDGDYNALVSSDYSSLKGGYEVTAANPVVEWIFANYASYDLTLPRSAFHDDLQKYIYLIPSNDYLFAAKEVCKEFKQAVPLVNLENMVIKCYILKGEGKYCTALSYKQDCENAYVIKDLTNNKFIDDKKRQATGLVFELKTEHIFRSISS
jgi:hypothetical protein